MKLRIVKRNPAVGNPYYIVEKKCLFGWANVWPNWTREGYGWNQIVYPRIFESRHEAFTAIEEWKKDNGIGYVVIWDDGK